MNTLTGLPPGRTKTAQTDGLIVSLNARIARQREEIGHLQFVISELRQAQRKCQCGRWQDARSW